MYPGCQRRISHAPECLVFFFRRSLIVLWATSAAEGRLVRSGARNLSSWLEISDIDRFGGKFTCQSQKRNPRTLYWPAVNKSNRDTKTKMASRMRRKRSVALSGLDYLITADFYGLFRFRLLVHKSYCYFSSELVFLVAFILYFRGTKTRESRLFRPLSLFF